VSGIIFKKDGDILVFSRAELAAISRLVGTPIEDYFKANYEKDGNARKALN
jgi:hypothetical protein